MNVQLTAVEKQRVLALIQTFFEETRDEHLGLLGAELVFDFFADYLAPVYYNRGLKDAHKVWQDIQTDLEYRLYELEAPAKDHYQF